MLRFGRVVRVALGFLLVCHLFPANGQAGLPPPIVLTVFDENGLPIPSAQVTLTELGFAPRLLPTDYLGRCAYSLRGSAPYEIDIDKPGFYRTVVEQVEPESRSLSLVLAHQQIVRQ